MVWAANVRELLLEHSSVSRSFATAGAKAASLVGAEVGEGTAQMMRSNMSNDDIPVITAPIMAADTGQQAEEDHFYDAQIAMFGVFVVFLALLAEPLVNWLHLRFVPISVIWILIGMISMFLLRSAGKDESAYDYPEVFFFLLIPPIIFNASYALEHYYFFGNFKAISAMAFLGTLISAVIIGGFLYIFTHWGVVDIHISAAHCFMFGAVLSSTDAVGVMSVLKSDYCKGMEKNIKTVIIGESILNDAVAITLFKTFDNNDFLSNLGPYHKPNQISRHVAFAIARFCYTAILSVITGAGFGLGTSYFSARKLGLKKYPKLEMTVTFFSAYMCYCISEITQASGMLAVFTCGLVLAHYHQHNISANARVTCKAVSDLTSHLAEIIVYIFLGMTMTRSLYKDEILLYNLSLVAVAFFLCLVSRAASVVVVSALVNSSSNKPRDRLTFRHQLLMWFSGVRGAISFALVVQISSASRGSLVTATLAIVVITTIINGIFYAPMVQCLGLAPAQLPGGKDVYQDCNHTSVHESNARNLWFEFDLLLANYFGGRKAFSRPESCPDLTRVPPTLIGDKEVVSVAPAGKI
ncbi:hypothetical protein AAMO2058_001595800 [Amorphochlora amoebiformis]